MYHESIHELLDQIIDTVPGLFDSTESNYYFGTRKVPRVTQIIQRCIHNDRLMAWANSLGFKHQNYSKVLSQAAAIGTQCHENINRFFIQPSIGMTPDIMAEARFAYESFRRWYDEICRIAVIEPLEHEKMMACKYFGGTLDGLYRINGKTFIIDYKTSNHITFNYCLQIAAYIYMLEQTENTSVDGCIVLQLSKSSVEYNEFVMDFNNPDQRNYIEMCKNAFLSAVLWYYQLCYIEKEYSILNWG